MLQTPWCVVISSCFVMLVLSQHTVCFRLLLLEKYTVSCIHLGWNSFAQ